MKKTISILTALLAAGAFTLGCSDTPASNDGGSDSGNPDVVNPGDGGSDGGNKPAPPTLGAQIDRFGRPAVNTALNHTFDTDTTAKGNAKDAYNADKVMTNWATNVPEFEKNLAILDALDGTCGNQLGYLASATGPARYAPLSGLLADDRMWVKADATTCTTYLAVEANALAIIPNSDCGGRKLDYDVMDITYSAASIGAVSGVTDGIDANATKTNGTTFPYLAPAQ